MPTISELITVFSSEVANKIMDVFEKIDGSLSLFKNENGSYIDEKGEYQNIVQGEYWSSSQWSNEGYLSNKYIPMAGYDYDGERYESDYDYQLANEVNFSVNSDCKYSYNYVLAIHSF